MKSTLICLITIVITVYIKLIVAIKQSDIEIRMKRDEIIPNILDKTPPKELILRYSKQLHVDFGNELTPTQVKSEPELAWEDAHNDKYHTLVMFDPDAPSKANPKLADVKHWLVGNIQGCEVATGDVIAEYFGAGPPKSTGLHRYIFLVFEQPGRIQFEESKSGKLSRNNRLRWSLNGFREKYRLGKIVAGNYFKAQWDEFVDERNKKIGPAPVKNIRRSGSV